MHNRLDKMHKIKQIQYQNYQLLVVVLLLILTIIISHTALIYYTGYGEEGTGNWCFKDGTISFQDIFTPYNKYLKGKLLYIITDCSYSGQWVVECAKCLDEMGIGACGHQIREQGILIKMWVSCQPHQKATSGSFVIQEGIYYSEPWNSIVVWYNKKLSVTQTTYGHDFTKTGCLQLIMKRPTSRCRLPDIPAKYSWKWQDLVEIDDDNTRRSLVHTVRGKDRGWDAWHVVLIEKALLNDFKLKIKAGSINVADYGFVVKSGWGKDPPDDVQKAIKKCSPWLC